MILTPQTPNTDTEHNVRFVDSIPELFNKKSFSDKNISATALHRETKHDFNILARAIFADYSHIWNQHILQSAEQFDLTLNCLEHMGEQVEKENRTSHDNKIIDQIDFIIADIKSLPHDMRLSAIKDHQNLRQKERYILHTDLTNKTLCCYTDPATQCTGRNNTQPLYVNATYDGHTFTAIDQKKIFTFSLSTIWRHTGKNNDTNSSALHHRAQTIQTNEPRLLLFNK